MTNEELNALFVVINYLWHDERKDFEECKLNDGGAPDHHVFPHVNTLDSYLFRVLGKRAVDVPPSPASDVSPFI